MTSKSEREEHWKKTSFGMLPIDALVSFVDQDGKIQFFATVVEREPALLATWKEGDSLPRPIVGLSFHGNVETVADVIFECECHRQWKVIQISSSFFSYKPILRHLQLMDSIPLGEAIIQETREDTVPAYLSDVDVKSYIAGAYPTLNPSQKEAMLLALGSKVAITQGPPGTGKTFVGVAIADVIYRNSDKTMLCVCYTNHALDQFLEALLDKGMTSLVRIGGRSKSPRLEPYNIREKARTDPQSGSLSRVFKRRVAELYGRREVLVGSIQESIAELQATSCLFRGRKWNEVKKWLWMHARSAFSEFDVQVRDDDGFAAVGDGGKRQREDWKWQLWIKGSDLKKGAKASDGSVWSLSCPERISLMEEWSRQMSQDVRECIAEAMVELAEVDAMLARAHQEPSYNILKSCRVIGCTTTGAAKFSDLISVAKPHVVIAEEAAEILEAHMLTSMSKHTEHLIMIGDHKQLRPKIENHALSVVSGNRHDLNCSLFERLVLGGCRHATLLVQHRMRPEISRLISATYPGLQDHSSVLDRADVRGVQSNVVFVDHDAQETQFENWKAQHESKTNQHEAEVVSNIARYLLRQDYAAEDMVILTPYLGQLFLIQKILKETLKLGIAVDDRDLADLKKMSGSSSDLGYIASSSDNGSVRVATIDNYQGEEADIVIASLVRSNQEGQIGFLKEPERLNVLLSRARYGLFIVGNAACMRSARNPQGRSMWNALLDDMQGQNQVVGGLPAQCATHGRTSMLRTAADFEEYAPSGGCTLQCGKKLPCGHFCPFKCHRFDPTHAAIRCTAVTYNYCDQGHMVKSACGSKQTQGCGVCDQLTKIEKKREKEVAALEEEQARKMQEFALQRAKDENDAKVLQRKLDDQAAQYEEAMASERRQLEMVRKQRELELRATYGADELESKMEAERARMQREIDEKETELRKKSTAARHADAEMRKGQQEKLNQHNRDLQKLDEKLRNAEFDAKAHTARATHQSSKDKSSFERRIQLVSQLKDAIAVKEGDLRLVVSKSVVQTIREVFELDIRQASQIVKDAQAEKQPVECSPQLKKGVKHLERQEWIQAYDVLALLTDTSPEATVLMAYCEAKLENYVEARDRLNRMKGSENLAGGRLARSVIEQANSNGQPTKATFAWALSACVHPAATADLGFIATDALEIIRSSQAALDSEQSAAPKLFAEVDAAEARRKKWAKSAGTSEALKDLLKLTGMSAVKQALMDLNDRVKLDIERGLDFKKQNFSIRFDGNPGTGKTTVARLYGQFLKEKGILPADTFVETSGSALVNGGTAELKKMLERLEAGGVLFVDEAYQLIPKTNSLGAQVLDYLLPEMENRRGKLVVIIAGYAKPMADLIAHNEGLPSRFPHHFTFEDYSDEELFEILMGIITGDGSFQLQNEKDGRIAARRVGNQRGATGFGNARAVRNLWDQTKTNQASRILRERDAGKDPHKMLIVREDLLGKRTIDASTCPALKELQGMRGLVKVKRNIQGLLSLVKTNAELEDAEKPLRKVALNRILIGNPGTGKTTVAGIYGRILKDLGMLSDGGTVMKTPQDFVGTVLGESEKNTKAILDDSRGKVLVIDEAYGLQPPNNTSDPYRTAVIDTIVAEVQGVPGDDRCVLLLGYTDEISNMLRNANPGLARRFQMDDAFEFEDYNDEDLLWILQRKAKAENLHMDLRTAREVVKLLAKQRMLPNFGNAGAINNMVSRAVQSMEKRLSDLPVQERAEAPVTAEDFLSSEQLSALDMDPKSLFDGLVGCNSIKEKLQGMQDTIQLSQSLGKDPLENLQLNFFFAGSPGTGKTTVARRMGQMFASLGLLAKPDVVECSASDFVTGFANQASGKTREMFRSALGGVLFIDEAYRLNPRKGGAMMSEVVDEIVNILTEEQFRNKMVVIFAGYEAELDELMTVNPGLKSRISEKIHFEDFGEETCCELLTKELKELVLDDDARVSLTVVFRSLIAAPYWSNGRDVKTLAARIFQAKATSSCKESAAAQSGQSETQRARTAVDVTVTRTMVETAGAKFLEVKKIQERTVASSEVVDGALQTASQQVGAGPLAASQTAVKAAKHKAEVASQKEELELRVVEEPGNFFQDIPSDFLNDINSKLLSAGVDITDASAVLAFDKEALFASLAALGGRDAALVRYLLDQWDKALKEAVELQHKIEEEIAERKRRQRPRWRCAVCGRMGCQVAPYIDGYDEVND